MVPTMKTRAAGLWRRIVIVASVLAKIRAQGRTAFAFYLLRGMPSGLRRWIEPLLPPVHRALAQAADGNLKQAVASLRKRQSPIAVEALCLVHRPDLAREIVTKRLPTATQARLLFEEGAFNAARDMARYGLRDLISGELGALQIPADLIRPRAVKTHMPRTVHRVCHLVTTSLPQAQSGYTLRTQGLAKAQLRAGKSVQVVTRVGFPLDIGKLRAAQLDVVEGVEYRRLLPTRGLPLRADARLRMAAQQLTRLAADGEFQVLHAHTKHHNAQTALEVAQRLSLPVVYEVRGFLEETWRSRGGSADSDFYRLSRQAETTCMQAANAVVTLSHTMREEIVSRGIDGDKVSVVPNCVGPDELEPLPDRNAARDQLGIPRDAHVVGTIATINHYEGLDVIINASERLRDRNMWFVVVGSGPDLSRLQALAKQAAVNAIFVGRVPPSRTRSYLAAMDVMCLPRRSTPVTDLVPPLKPLEAMAAGIPVLASNLPPLAELVDSSQGGWLVPAQATSQWAETLAELWNQPQELARAGAAGKQWVQAERTWQHASQRLDTIYARAGVG